MRIHFIRNATLIICLTTRAQLRLALGSAGLTHKVIIPQDGETVEIEG